MGDVFAALNKGGDVTTGLKHVKKGEGIQDRKVPVPKAASATPAVPKAAPAASKPPKFALNGKKWEVEYQVKNTALEIKEAEQKHTVYIYQCTDSVIQESCHCTRRQPKVSPQLNFDVLSCAIHYRSRRR